MRGKGKCPQKADEGLTVTPGKRLISSIVQYMVFSHITTYLGILGIVPWELDTCEISNPLTTPHHPTIPPAIVYFRFTLGSKPQLQPRHCRSGRHVTDLDCFVATLLETVG